MKPTIAKTFKPIQRVQIDALSHPCGLKTRIIRMPTASFGKAILKKAIVSVRMTQKAASGIVCIGLSAVTLLVDARDFWKIEARVRSRACYMSMRRGSGEQVIRKHTHETTSTISSQPALSLLIRAREYTLEKKRRVAIAVNGHAAALAWSRNLGE